MKQARQKAVEKRQQYFADAFHSSEAFRLIHREAPPLRVDKVGEVLVMGWWSDERPTEAQIKDLGSWSQGLGFSQWYLQWRPSRASGHTPEIVAEGPEPVPENWIFTEKGVKYQARKQQGDAFGLFLDQRDNRQWLGSLVKGKRVLNLFSFTCGFSLQAALGGAETVVSVDLSPIYLEWGQTNFALNGLPPDKYEFRRWDSLEYLSWAARKKLEFDFIVCDPPSFSRNGKKVFKVDKDCSQLLGACRQLLAKDGKILFATNFEKWSRKKWQQVIEEAGFNQVEWRAAQQDFDSDRSDPILKSFVIR